MLTSLPLVDYHKLQAHMWYHMQNKMFVAGGAYSYSYMYEYIDLLIFVCASGKLTLVLEARSSPMVWMQSAIFTTGSYQLCC